MKIALIGNQIPSLLPGFLADLYYATKAGGTLALHEPNEVLRLLLEDYACKVIAQSKVAGSLVASGDKAAVLKNADVVIFADSAQNASRFEMDKEALSGDKGGEGLRNQARLHDGIEGLLFTLRTGEKVLQLVEAMRRQCPDATVLNLSEPLSQTTALFHLEGFNCYAFGADALRGQNGVEGLCHLIKKKQSLLTYEVAGLYRFAWLMQLQGDKDLMPLAQKVVKQGKMGADKALFCSWYDAVPIGEGHGESLPENEAFSPDESPVFSESIERRKERIVCMNAVVQKGLDSTEGKLSHLKLLRDVSALRPIKGYLEQSGIVIRQNNGSIAALPREAIIQAQWHQSPLWLADTVLDITLDVANGQLLCAQAARGGTEQLREYIETAPPLAGLDRLYLQSLVKNMIALHQDVLSRF